MSAETVISEAVIASILNPINDLTSKVDNLTVGKAADPPSEDDQHISVTSPATVLNVYPELEGLIPSMSEDFYRTMLTDEEKKEEIYAFPKSSNVCYNPTPIKEAAHGSVKKADAAFYAIQVTLAHGTRPIDYFIHRMLQSNPNLTIDDPVVDVLNTIRCIMGNVASMATQSRLDNLNSGMSFTGKPEQVVESDVKPLMDNEKFETQLAAIKPTKRDRVRRLFRGRQQIEGRPSPVSSSTATAPITEAAATRSAPNASRGGGGREYEPRILQHFILHSKEDGRATICIESKEAEPASRGKELQDGIPAINLQDNQEKGFYDVPGFEGRIPAYSNQEVVQKILALLFEWTKLPVPCSTVRSFAESSYIHKNPASSSELGTDSENQGIRILKRPDNSRRIDRSMNETHRAYTFEAYRARILDKYGKVRANPLSENHTPWYDHRQQGDVLESSNIKDPRPTTRSRKTDKRWEDVAQMLSELYRKGTSDVGGAIAGKINAAPTAGTEEQILAEESFMDIDGAPIRRSNSESTILEGPFEEMEWSVVPAGNPRNRDIHRCERYCLGCRHRPQELLWFMEKIRGNTPHQLQGATRRSNCIETERSGGPVGSDLLRQYYHPSIRKEIRWNYLTQTSQHSEMPMGALLEDEYQSSSNVCPVSSESGGCTEPLNGSDRMVREARRGPLCISDQQEDTKILQLVPGPSICRPERAAVQLGRLEEPLLLPALEPDRTDSPEDETRANNNDYNYTRMDVGDLVSGHVSTVDLTATNSTSNRGSPRSEKRKVPAHQEQGLDSNGMENQRSALKDKGVSDTAIELIFNSQRPSMDISPIIEYFREIGDNEQLDIKSLTSKTCWLLAVCGFMRASDIHRIDDAQTNTIDGTLKLVIVAPKEKFKGRPITRPCEISCHSDKLLCPVAAYRDCTTTKYTYPEGESYWRNHSGKRRNTPRLNRRSSILVKL
ncbi:hypothetical protein AYI70_g1621 [Smittium culicis]|uniref:Uncharacterized protein n=1 Tax=Smittium culicis TaxID=133412 RepID=A0A1R1YCI7_9FUNG|nr:hypothetical protein AYI70_g1621 [Smittium culicis]